MLKYTNKIKLASAYLNNKHNYQIDESNIFKLDINNFTEIANNIIPKNFLNTYTPPDPIKRAIKSNFRITKYTTAIFRTSAIIIFDKKYSALSDNKAVNEPAPAIKGKTTGTIVVVPLGPSILNNSMPNIISTAIPNITKAPATAKEDISTPKSFKITSPINKNAKKVAKENTAALFASICSPFSFNEINIGISPATSITANSTTKALTICKKSKFKYPIENKNLIPSKLTKKI